MTDLLVAAGMVVIGVLQISWARGARRRYRMASGPVLRARVIEARRIGIEGGFDCSVRLYTGAADAGEHQLRTGMRRPRGEIYVAQTADGLLWLDPWERRLGVLVPLLLGLFCILLGAGALAGVFGSV